jgi:hemerythrin superfamily protein
MRRAGAFVEEDAVDAIRFLKKQHDEVADLFEEIDTLDSEDEKQAIFKQIADNLAIHATIEERFFYPAVRQLSEDEVEEAYDEHLEIKRLLVECMRMQGERGFDVKLAALESVVLHHVEEEENVLFPEVRRMFTPDALEALGQRLEGESADLEEKGNARLSVKPEIEPPSIQP